MGLPVLLALLFALVAAPVPTGRGGGSDGVEDPFRVGGLPPREVLATGPWPPEALAPQDLPMLGRLRGVLGTVSPQGVVGLRRGLGRALRSDESAAATVVGVLHLARGADCERLEVLDLGDGRRGVRAVDRSGTPAWQVRPDALDAAGIDWWLVGWKPLAAEPGARLRIEHEGSPARLTLDAAAVRRVFRARFPPLSREIADETFHIRLPQGHDPSRPAGVLVWISPTDDGRLPPLLERGADELGLIAVGADNAGNTRPLTDRLQLMLDAIETARRRFVIDEQRVYVTGMSGGGRCAGIMQCTMPEIFAGAVLIVGIDTYHNAPTGEGNARWAARFGKPPAPVFHLLKSRRIAPITGDMDFNEKETRIRSDLLIGDGLIVRLEVVPGMGHTLPRAEKFAEMLAWVDEPRREAIKGAEAEAERLLAGVPDGAADSPDTRAALEAVIAAAPWSDPAWRAAERLGFSREAFVSGGP